MLLGASIFAVEITLQIRCTLYHPVLFSASKLANQMYLFLVPKEQMCLFLVPNEQVHPFLANSLKIDLQ